MVGSALFTFEQALAYSLERKQFGVPIASFQLQQEKFAWMFTEISKGLLLALRLGRLKAVSYTHLRAHETPEHIVCRFLLEKKKYDSEYFPQEYQLEPQFID